MLNSKTIKLNCEDLDNDNVEVICQPEHKSFYLGLNLKGEETDFIRLNPDKARELLTFLQNSLNTLSEYE